VLDEVPEDEGIAAVPVPEEIEDLKVRSRHRVVTVVTLLLSAQLPAHSSHNRSLEQLAAGVKSWLHARAWRGLGWGLLDDGSLLSKLMFDEGTTVVPEEFEDIKARKQTAYSGTLLTEGSSSQLPVCCVLAPCGPSTQLVHSDNV
jgi:hypothetical protein